MIISIALLAFGVPLADPLTIYKICVSSAASEVGHRSTISEAMANQIVAKCRSRLADAAEQMVDKGYSVFLPLHMQTREVLLKSAAFDIEHEAKMSISAQILPLPVR